MENQKTTRITTDFRQIHSRLVESIYATAADPAIWDRVICDLVTGTDSRSARLLVLNADASRVFSSLKHNIDDHYHHQYVNHYVNTCPWRPELRKKARGQLYSTYLHFSCRQPDFLRSEFYNDWARPQDIHHGICGTIYQDEAQTVQLLIQRTEKQGYFTETETDFFNGLVPHMQHAIQLANQLADSKARTEAIEIAASHEMMPFVLLDFRLRPIYCNSDAEVLLKTEPALCLKKEHLQLTDRENNLALQRLLNKCLNAADSRSFHFSGGMLKISRPDSLPLHLWAKPVHPDIPLMGGKTLGYVAVYLYDPQQNISINEKRLAELYNLSKAETRVAIEMVATPNPAEVAQRCCLSLHTVRSHLKSIFCKTGTKNQAELIRKLLSGPTRQR